MDEYHLLHTIDNAEHIGSAPNIAIALADAINDPNFNSAKAAYYINMDPTIAALILKVSNSAYYSRGQQIKTVQQAITHLGLETVKKLVFAIEMIGKYRCDYPYTSFDYPLFWKNIIAVAMLADAIAVFSNFPDPDSSYLAGLLSNIGLLFMRQYYPYLFKQVLDNCKRSEISFAKSADGIWFYDHKFLSYLIGIRWGLPDRVIFGFKECLRSKDSLVPHVYNHVYMAESILHMKHHAVWDMYFEPCDEALFTQYHLDKPVIDRLASDIIEHVSDLSVKLFEHA
jgi:HD-like signal output (HDOD) protein